MLESIRNFNSFLVYFMLVVFLVGFIATIFQWTLVVNIAKLLVLVVSLIICISFIITIPYAGYKWYINTILVILMLCILFLMFSSNFFGSLFAYLFAYLS